MRRVCGRSLLFSLWEHRVNLREIAEPLSSISSKAIGSCHPTTARQAHSLPRYFEPMTFHRRSRWSKRYLFSSPFLLLRAENLLEFSRHLSQGSALIRLL